MLPHGYQVLPHGYQVLPHGYQVLPHGYQVLPHGYQVLPHRFRVLPHGYQVLPHRFRLLPHQVSHTVLTCDFDPHTVLTCDFFSILNQETYSDFKFELLMYNQEPSQCFLCSCIGLKKALGNPLIERHSVFVYYFYPTVRYECYLVTLSFSYMYCVDSIKRITRSVSENPTILVSMRRLNNFWRISCIYVNLYYQPYIHLILWYALNM